MALAARMAMAAPAAAALQHTINGTQDGFGNAHAGVRVSVRASNASVSAVLYGRLGSSGGAGVLERPGLDQLGTDSAPRTSEGMFRSFLGNPSLMPRICILCPPKLQVKPQVMARRIKTMVQTMATSLPHLWSRIQCPPRLLYIMV